MSDRNNDQELLILQQKTFCVDLKHCQNLHAGERPTHPLIHDPRPLPPPTILTPPRPKVTPACHHSGSRQGKVIHVVEKNKEAHINTDVELRTILSCLGACAETTTEVRTPMLHTYISLQLC